VVVVVVFVFSEFTTITISEREISIWAGTDPTSLSLPTPAAREGSHGAGMARPKRDQNYGDSRQMRWLLFDNHFSETLYR
jgi:hypothetical protein